MSRTSEYTEKVVYRSGILLMKRLARFSSHLHIRDASIKGNAELNEKNRVRWVAGTGFQSQWSAPCFC